MSKPNTDQPTPLVVAGEATETASAPVVKKFPRLRAAVQKPVTYAKNHKKTTIAVVGLSALVAGSAYLGRASAASSDETTTDSDVNPDVEDEQSPELDNTVA